MSGFNRAFKASMLFAIAVEISIRVAPVLAQSADAPLNNMIPAAISIATATVTYLILLALLNWLRRRLVSEAERLYERSIASRLHVRNPENLQAQVVAAIAQVSKLLRNIAVVLLSYVYLAIVLRFLPFARHILDRVTETSFTLLTNVWQGFIDYLPNLFILLIIVTAMRYLGIVLGFIFEEIGRGTIVLPGFYPEWAEPTHNLALFLIFVLGAAIAFPYLPGFDTPIFQGVTLFGAILGAIGARESISDVISGVVLIYTRPFLLGDRITINDIKGTVVEKTLFVTRVRTPKNAIVTIPNRVLRDSDVVNYSACLRELDAPLIVPVTVTLGYDVCWQEVYRVLLEAALEVEFIVSEPAPFVLQTSLGDFSVSYELNVYTDRPERMERIFSDLHQCIQDRCSAAGIEILSPSYAAVRDGNTLTIPERERIEPTPSFRLEIVDRNARKNDDRPGRIN